MSRSVSSSLFGVCGALAIALAACGGGGDDDGGGGRADSSPFADAAPTVDGTPGTDGAPGTDAPPASACASPPAFTVGTASTGTTVGHGPSAFEGTCVLGEPSGPETTFAFTAPSSGTLELTMLSDADLGIYITTVCGDAATELGCVDNEFGGAPETLRVDVTSGATYYVVIDGYTPEDVGAFELSGRVIDYAGMCGAAGPPAAGTTVGGSVDFDGLCAPPGAPSVLYAYTPGVTGETGDVTVTIASASDLGLHVRTTCADAATEVYCGDTQAGGTNEVLKFAVDGGVPLTLFVDGFLPGFSGPFTLDVAYTTAVCGNGVREGKEACDAAALPTATCSATCTALTPTTETNCNDLIDDDKDGAPDCRDIDCGCVSGPGALASACDAPADCSAGGSDPFCFDFATFGWPSGHCSQYCDPSDTSGAECGTGNLCLPTTTVAAGTGLCFKACTTAATDCPSADYHCEPIGAAATPVCWPNELCADGKDNSADGHVDCDDAGCAGQGACAAATEIEPNNDAATANVYAAGYRGTIGTAGDLDWVAVTVPGPASAIAAKVGDAGNGGCAGFSIDSYVEIYAADGTTRIAVNEDMAFSSYCARAGASGLAAGTYYVVAESSPDYAPSDTFNYTLDVTVTP